MAEKAAEGTQAAKRPAQHVPEIPLEPEKEPSRLPGPLAGLIGSSDDPGLNAQAARLGDRRFSPAQRQAMARQIGRLQGNRHLQRVLAELSPPAAVTGRAGLPQIEPPPTIRRGAPGRAILQREDGEDQPAAAPQPGAAATAQPNGDAAVSDAIRSALRQYQEMPIDVPVNDPRLGAAAAGESQQVHVRVPYFLYSGRRRAGAEAAQRRSPAVRGALSGIPIETRVGKGSPAQVRQAVQSAVNQGLVRQGRGRGWPPTADDIRTWMQTYGLGIDCSGFVYWALWQVQANRGGEQAAEEWAQQFQSGGRTRRGWGGLMLRGAQQIEAPGQLRPGDIAQWRTTGDIGHYRIVMATRQEGEHFYFTLAESSGGAEGPNVREFRAATDATGFNTIQEERDGAWRLASRHNRTYDYWRRAETNQGAAAAGQPEGAGATAPAAEDRPAAAEAPGSTPAETPPAPSTMPSREEVYGSGRGSAGPGEQAGSPAPAAEPAGGAGTAGAGAQSGGPAPASETTAPPAPWLTRAVGLNTSLGARLGWQARVDDIVSHFQSLVILPAGQTPNQERFAEAVRQFQRRHPRLANDGILGRNSWRVIQAEMAGGAAAPPAGSPAAPGAPAAAAGDQDAYEYSLRVTGQFESGGNYGALQLIDVGVISYGKYQNTLTSGNLFRVLQAWVGQGSAQTEAPGAHRVIQDRLSAGAQSFRRNHGLARDQQFLDALREAGRSASMRTAQDSYHRTTFFEPAARRAQAQGVQSPIGIALFFDTANQSWAGLDYCIEQMGGANAQAMGERVYLNAFLDARIRYLRRVAASQRRRAQEARSQGNEGQARRLERTAGMLERAPQRRIAPLRRRLEADLQ